MAHLRLQKLVQSAPTSATLDVAIGTRGGILLNLELYNIASEYWDASTSSQRAKLGDISVVVADFNGSSILGQGASDYIKIPVGGSWSWRHPMFGDIIDAAPIIEKLAFNNVTGFIPQPVGLITTFAIRFAVQSDTVLNVAHKCQIEAEILSFDSSAI